MSAVHVHLVESAEWASGLRGDTIMQEWCSCGAYRYAANRRGRAAKKEGPVTPWIGGTAARRSAESESKGTT